MNKDNHLIIMSSCAKWCIENYNHEEDNIYIIAVINRDGYHEGIVHSYLLNEETDECFDKRGSFKSDDDLLYFFGFDSNGDPVDAYDVFSEQDAKYEFFKFDSVIDFKRFLIWYNFDFKKNSYRM